MIKDVEIRVEQGNVTDFNADILVLKHAERFHGVDLAVASDLNLQKGPDTGQHLLARAPREYGTREVLFLGVGPLHGFGYTKIRDFAAAALRILKEERPRTTVVHMTLHGSGYGLDESEAALAQVAGLLDAINSRAAPPDLRRVSIIEIDPGRVERVKGVVVPWLENAIGETGSKPVRSDVVLTTGGAAGDREAVKSYTEKARTQEVGVASEAKPHAFVAMPFDSSMDDVFYYGIQKPVHEFGFLCARVDQEHFVGEIMNRVKERIRASEIVIAELTGANPNVYLEVGYAWGLGRPTLFCVRDPGHLRFDLQGHRCIAYERIQDLERSILAELKGLRQTGTIS